MRHAVAIPIIVFLAVSALASPLLARLQDISGLNPDVLRLTVFSTAVGAAVVWLVWRQGLAYPAKARAQAGRPVLTAVALSLVAGVIALSLAKIEGAPWRTPRLEALGAPLAIVLIVQVLGAAAEEVGWRGLVQPLLETRLSAWKAALITGLLFGAGHFYLAFGISPPAFALFIVSAVAVSLILALATVGGSWRRRIVVATLLHFLINMETLFLFSDGDTSVLYFADLAAAFGVSGVVALLLLRRRRGAEGA